MVRVQLHFINVEKLENIQIVILKAAEILIEELITLIEHPSLKLQF